MEVVTFRDVLASSQTELFFPKKSTVLQIKFSLYKQLDSRPLPSAQHLIHCGRMLSDYDTLEDVLKHDVNRSGTRIIHVVVDGSPPKCSKLDSDSKSISNYEYLCRKKDENIYFDVSSIKYAKEMLIKSEVLQDTVNMNQRNLDSSNVEGQKSAETVCPLTEASIKINNDPNKKECIENVYLYATMLQGDPMNINYVRESLLDTSPPVIPADHIPPPRWIDIVLLLRMGVSMYLFCGHMSLDKIIGIGSFCFFYYLLDTGIIRYAYRILFQKYLKMPIQRPMNNQPIPSINGNVEANAGDVEGRVPLPPQTMSSRLTHICGQIFHWIHSGFPIPKVEDTGYSVICDLFALILGFVMSIFPNWNIRGMHIPW